MLEEINNVQKNRDRESHSSGMNRKPVAAWAQTLCSDLVDGKHRWTAAQPDVPVKSKTTKIPKECFEPTPSKRSIDSSDIVSTDQTSYWHSPQATNNTVNCGDHELLNDCKVRYGTFNEVGEAWQGELLRSTHNLVIKVRVNSQRAWRFLYPLLPLENSSVLAWPIHIHPVHSSNGSVVHCEVDVKRPQMISVFDMCSPDLQCCSVTWKAPLNQDLDKCMVSPAGVRPYVDNNWSALHVKAAECAFWERDKCMLHKIARRLHLNGIPASCDLYEMLWLMIKKILKATDDRVLKTIMQRISHQERGMQFGKEIYCLYEAMEVLEETDKRILLEEQTRVPDQVLANKHSREKHRARAQMMKVKTKSAADKKKAKKPRTKELFKYDFEASFDVPLQQGQRFLSHPKKVTLWRAVTGRQAWCGHCPLFPRCSKAFGEDRSCMDALAEVLAMLWGNWTTIEGLTLDDCPYDFGFAIQT